MLVCRADGRCRQVEFLPFFVTLSLHSPRLILHWNEDHSRAQTAAGSLGYVELVLWFLCNNFGHILWCKAIARIYPVHAMNVELCHVAAGPQTKPTNLDHEFTFRLVYSAPISLYIIITYITVY